MSSDTLEEIIQALHDLNAAGYYAIATTAILFYDYLLTLADEVKYAWSGKKSWIFALYILVSPAGIQDLAVHLGLPPVILATGKCNKTAFLPIFMYVWCTLLAQIALTLRIHAVTRKNRLVTTCFGIIATLQLAVGLYFIFLTATTEAQRVSLILSDDTVCIYARQRHVEFAFPAISLVYDFLAFLVIIYVAVESKVWQFGIPSLFRTLAQDATRYFLVIFTSHLVLELTLIFGTPSIQNLPASGNAVYLPMMVARLMLSLKKASTSQEDIWSFGQPSTDTSVRFAEGRGLVGATRDEIGLETFRGRDGRTELGVTL